MAARNIAGTGRCHTKATDALSTRHASVNDVPAAHLGLLLRGGRHHLFVFLGGG